MPKSLMHDRAAWIQAWQHAEVGQAKDLLIDLLEPKALRILTVDHTNADDEEDDDLGAVDKQLRMTWTRGEGWTTTAADP